MQKHRIQRGIRFVAALGMALTGLWQAAPARMAQAAQPAAAPAQDARPGIGLTLDAKTPASNGHTAPLNSHVVLTYSASLNAATVTSRTIAVHSMMHGLVTATQSVNGGVVTITPSKPFFVDELVQTTATTATQASVGGMRPAASTWWQFRAGAPKGWGYFGTFGNVAGPGLSPPPDHVNDLTIGDFNGDGFPDIAPAYSNGVGVLYFNDGNGNFPNTSLYKVIYDGGYSSYSGIAAGDFNGDGVLDFAAGRKYDGDLSTQVRVFLNDGTGNFSETQRFDGPIPGGIHSNGYPVSGDFNGDGFLDLANEAVYLNDGTGHFD